MLHVSLWRYPFNKCLWPQSSGSHHHRYHHCRHVGVIWVASPFALLHYHKKDLRLIDANGSLFFSIINRPLPWPQAMIEAVFCTCSLKQCARPEMDPWAVRVGRGYWKDLCPSNIFVIVVFLQLRRGENSMWSGFSFLLYDAHDGFSVQGDSEFAYKKKKTEQQWGPDWSHFIVSIHFHIFFVIGKCWHTKVRKINRALWYFCFASGYKSQKNAHKESETVSFFYRETVDKTSTTTPGSQVCLSMAAPWLLAKTLLCLAHTHWT